MLREFPRLPLYHDWAAWVKMGRELLELHIGFEGVEGYPLERVETGANRIDRMGRIVDEVGGSTDSGRTGYGESPPSQPSPLKGEGAVGSAVNGEGVSAPRVMLRANARDRELGEIHIDSETVLRGVPADAWRYRLGSRSALEWVLDQYKEKKPRNPTIAAKFNTYRFADYKEEVIELLGRVCTVSVRTMEVVDGMEALSEDRVVATSPPS